MFRRWLRGVALACVIVPVAACSSGNGDARGPETGGGRAGHAGQGSGGAGATAASSTGSGVSGGGREASGRAGDAGSEVAGMGGRRDDGASGSSGSAGSEGSNPPSSLDMIVFGNQASESAHGFGQRDTTVVTGALAEVARQALPRTPAAVNGGELTFTLAIDATRRNYVTVKFWGGDGTQANASDMGRLYLYVVKDGKEHQLGYRHEGDYAPLNVASGKPALPGRFFYSTTLLPLDMTLGLTSITLRIASTGRIYALGSGTAPSGNYQFLMNTNSRGIYRAYSHLNPLLVPVGEAVGSAPVARTRPVPGEEVLAADGSFLGAVNRRIEDRLSASVSVTTFTSADVLYLARSHAIAGLAGHRDARVVTRVTAVIDAFTRDYSTNGSAAVSGGGNEGWGGRYGALGFAISRLAAELAVALDESVDYGGSIAQTTRRAAWAELLLASREFGRTTRDSRYITNQNILANVSIYGANLGLLALGDSRAFSAVEAERYLREAIGIEPWLGSDLPTGGSSRKFGAEYLQVTRKGLSREWGYVGISYGEMQSHAADFFAWTGDVIYRDQALKMLRARSFFRRPALEVVADEHYRSMEGIGLLAWRGVSESDGDFANEIAYGERTGGGARALRVAAVTRDPAALGYAQQMLEDGQYFSTLGQALVREPTVLDVFEDAAIVKAAAASAARLPMTDGQPDFAWADEENGVVAIKHGSERLWVAPYWQAKSGTGVNGLARFHFSSPGWDQYGVLETHPEFRSTGKCFVRPDRIDKPEGDVYTPPERPLQAYAGERLPLAASDLVAVPADPEHADYAPFRGKADFYAFRFGHYLIGLNMSETRRALLALPRGSGNVPELVTRTSRADDVPLEPLTTAVLYLPTLAPTDPLPAAPLCVEARALTATSAEVSWTRASGALGYRVQRATDASGPFSTLVENTTESRATDAELVAGAHYLYKVTAVNEQGESSFSTLAPLTTPP